jgi:HK97 family phage portal protein
VEKMNIFGKIARKLGFNKSTENNANNSFYDFLGVDRNTKEDVLSEATYFACMKVLSEALGKLPLKVYRYNDQNGVEVARKHDLYYVLHNRPNPYMTAANFWSTIEYNRNHHGNAYAWIQGVGRDTKLWILPSEDVEVWYDDAKILADVPDIYYKYSAGGKQYVLGSEEVLHFKTFDTFDGLTGKSVRKQLSDTVGGSVKSQKLINKMYDSGFTAKAVLNYTGSLNDANVEQLVKNIENYAKGGLKNRGVENVIPIPLGFKLDPLNIKLADNQFVEVKQYSSLQIASAFGIKPYQIGDYTKSSYASAEAQQLSFYVDTLLYILKHYEEEITYKLLSREDMDSGYFAKFNVSVILRADLATQITTLSTAVNSFLMTPNEARAKLDLGNVDGGDRLLGNGASIPVQLTGSQYSNNKPEEDTSDDGDSSGDTQDSTPDNDNDEGGGSDNA